MEAAIISSHVLRGGHPAAGHPTARENLRHVQRSGHDHFVVGIRLPCATPRKKGPRMPKCREIVYSV